MVYRKGWACSVRLQFDQSLVLTALDKIKVTRSNVVRGNIERCQPFANGIEFAQPFQGQRRFSAVSP